MRCSYAVNATMIPGRVMETERFKLNCIAIPKYSSKVTENFWKSCVWTRNNDAATCSQKAVKGFETIEDGCDTSMKAAGVEVDSEKPFECKLVVSSASLLDRGNWTCMLRKCKDLKDGGCSSEAPSECMAEASVFVKVFTIFLETNINYTVLLLVFTLKDPLKHKILFIFRSTIMLLYFPAFLLIITIRDRVI